MPEPGALNHAQISRIMAGLMPAIFVGAIDQSLVAVALYSIGKDLNNLGLMPWVLSANLVAATVCTPIYGRLSDLYGRRLMLTVALAICAVATVLCALAQTMEQLVFFRVLQGLGAGSVFALGQAAIADVVPGTERGRYQGYFSGVFAVAALCGPLLGGYLTHWLSWRAIFWVNLPLVALALWLMRRALAGIAVKRHVRRIDWVGAALLTAGVGSLLIAVSRVGQGIAWGAPSTLMLLAAAVVVLVVWVLQSQSAAEPIVPLDLFRNRTVSLNSLTLALNFFVLLGASALLPLAMQSLGGAAPNEAALRMLPLSLGVPAGAFVAGRMMVSRPDHRWLLVGGCLASAMAMAGLSLFPIAASLPVAALMAVLGAGLGMTLPVGMVAAQMAVGPGLIGVVTGVTSFFRSLGGALGVALLSSLLFVWLGDAANTAAGALQAQAAGRAGEGPAALSLLAGGDPVRVAEAFAATYRAAAVVSILAAISAAALPAMRQSATTNANPRVRT